MVSQTLEVQFDRTKRSGKSKLENSMKIEGLKGKKVRVTILNSEGKVLERKTTETL